MSNNCSALSISTPLLLSPSCPLALETRLPCRLLLIYPPYQTRRRFSPPAICLLPKCLTRNSTRTMVSASSILGSRVIVFSKRPPLIGTTRASAGRKYCRPLRTDPLKPSRLCTLTQNSFPLLSLSRRMLVRQYLVLSLSSNPFHNLLTTVAIPRPNRGFSHAFVLRQSG